MKTGTLEWISLILLIIGGLNWGLIGLFNIDIVAMIFGTMSGLTRIIYILVGLAAVYIAFISTTRTGRI